MNVRQIQKNKQTIKSDLNKLITQLNDDINHLSHKNQEMSERLVRYEKDFTRLQNNLLFKILNKSYVKQKLKNGLAYMVGRRNLKRLYSETYKNKQASNDLKKDLRALYEDGFIESTIDKFERLYVETKNQYVKRAVAWELLFWHANKQTKVGAEQALLYFFDSCYKERDEHKLQEKAILASECMVTLGLYEEAEKLLSFASRLNENHNLVLAKANVAQGMIERIYLFNAVYTAYQLEPISLKNNYSSFPYAQLDAHADEVINHEKKVSIIVPAYNAEELIHITLDSLMKQTWANLEILVVDDCSSDGTYEIVCEYKEKDERISLYQTPKNSGAYTARNIGLKHAKGDFVTINDADDWSHPRKIEIQMKHLLAHDHVIANTSQLSRVTENLFAYRRGTRGTYIFSNMSSLLFRREAVMEKLGYWDSVRFAADGEFKRRLQRQFGKEAVIDLDTGPLSLALQSEHSLTANSAFGYHGAFVGARKEYVESFDHYYEESGSLYYPYPLIERKFPVPKPMLPSYQKGERYVDMIIVADLYHLTKEQLIMLEQMLMIHQQKGSTTGLVHMPIYSKLSGQNKIDDKVRSWIAGERVQSIVYGEVIRSQLAIILTITSFEKLQKYIPKIKVLTTLNVVDETVVNHYNRVNAFKLRDIRNHHMTIFNRKGNWFYFDEAAKMKVNQTFKQELKYIPFRKHYWRSEGDQFKRDYVERVNAFQLEEGGGIYE